MRASVLFFGLLLGLVVVALADFDKPTLLWSLGGSCGYNCQRGWYSSPAVATDPVTGEKLIVSAAYDVYCMYGNGTTKWSAQSPGGGRVWPGIVIVDLDKDGKLEVVVAFGGGYVSAYNLTDGAIYYPNFPYKPSGVDDEFRALAVADINQDAGMEILLGRAYSGNTNTYGLTYYGSPLPGYPLGTDQSKGYTWGVYNSNLGIADMDNDGKYEVISPSDVHYVCVYYADGTPYPCNSQYAANGGRTNWGQVGFYYNVTWENQGYGPCDSAADAAIRTNFANGPVVVADLDNDGTNEYVFTGRTYYCNDESPAFVGIHITNADRTRYKNTAKGYDWTTLPDPATGKPLAIGDYDTIEDTQFNAAVGNLDGDSNGELEIVYPGWDGKMYAHWLDKNPRGVWPFDMKSLSSTSSIVFGTEPAIVDIDNDGKAEVIFGTWTTKTSGDFGYLVILDSSGNLVYKIPLDEPLNSNAQWNGILACPTVANIDSDPNLEVVVLSAYSGTLAYRLHNSTNAKIHWGTSRGNQQRTASVTLPTVGPGSPPPASINSGVSTLIASWVAVVEYLLRFVL